MPGMPNEITREQDRAADSLASVYGRVIVGKPDPETGDAILRGLDGNDTVQAAWCVAPDGSVKSYGEQLMREIIEEEGK
jgi:hypothetical protein